MAAAIAPPPPESTCKGGRSFLTGAQSMSQATLVNMMPGDMVLYEGENRDPPPPPPSGKCLRSQTQSSREPPHAPLQCCQEDRVFFVLAPVT